MLMKPRNKPKELVILESLSPRIEFPEKIKQQYASLEKGFAGEKLFDSFLSKLEADVLILNDLLLKVNQTTFQIDSIVITSDGLYVYEVKNYAGDYVYDSKQDKFFRKPNYEIVNPLYQLGRTESLLKQLLHQQGFNLPVSTFLVFINQSFTLYQAPVDKPIIHPTQLREHFHQINSIRSKLTRSHHLLAKKLVELHIEKSPFMQLPTYHYAELKKGIVCSKCRSIETSLVGRLCICYACEHKELAVEAIMRAVYEFQLLFPERKVTSNAIYDWCKIVPLKQRIKRILEKHMKKEGTNRWTYYR